MTFTRSRHGARQRPTKKEQRRLNRLYRRGKIIKNGVVDDWRSEMTPIATVDLDRYFVNSKEETTCQKK